jgi:hypothetical protein
MAASYGRSTHALDITVDAPDKSEVTDRNGVPVHVGTVVRVLSIPDSVFRDLPGEEVADLRSMLGQSFPVHEIDQWGSACVQLLWDLGNGEYNIHELMLSSNEMEVVSSDV